VDSSPLREGSVCITAIAFAGAIAVFRNVRALWHHDWCFRSVVLAAALAYGDADEARRQCHLVDDLLCPPSRRVANCVFRSARAILSDGRRESAALELRVDFLEVLEFLEHWPLGGHGNVCQRPRARREGVRSMR